MIFFRWFFVCLPLTCLGCSVALPEHMQLFKEAQSAFDAEDYRQSAALYQQLLDQGVRSGTVYYNLGNAWAKADEPVRAIVAYYLAKRFIPNDPHLNANLRTVLTNNGGTMPMPERSLAGSLFFWQDWVGYNTKIWSSSVLTLLTFFGGVLFLFRRSKRFKRWVIGLAIFTAIILLSVGYDWYRFDGVEQIIVTASTVPRKGNSEQYEPAFVSPIPFGTQAVVLDERSGWFLLRFPNSQEGWLPQSQTCRLQ